MLCHFHRSTTCGCPSKLGPLVCCNDRHLLHVVDMPAFCKQNLKCAQARCQLSEAESGIVGHVHGEHSGDHNHQDFSKVLRCEWEAYCNTNGRRTAIQMGGSTDNISLSSECRGTESTAIQIGGILQYKLEVHCDTFSRSSGGWGSDILLSSKQEVRRWGGVV